MPGSCCMAPFISIIINHLANNMRRPAQFPAQAVDMHLIGMIEDGHDRPFLLGEFNVPALHSAGPLARLRFGLLRRRGFPLRWDDPFVSAFFSTFFSTFFSAFFSTFFSALRACLTLDSSSPISSPDSTGPGSDTPANLAGKIVAQNLHYVPGALHQGRALLDEPVAPGERGLADGSGQGEDLPALLPGQPGRDQAAAVVRGLGHQHPEGQPR